jgi:chemotaxis protein MotB
MSDAAPPDKPGAKKGPRYRPLTAHKAHVEEEGGEGNWLVSYADMMTLLVGFFVILLSFSKVDEEKFEEARKSVTEQFGGVFSVPYEKLFQKLNETLKSSGMGELLVIKTTDAGITISLRGTIFFETGKADLKPDAQDVLAKMISAIKAEQTAFDITVEGHTDDVPLSGHAVFKNNFELSSIRACRVIEGFSKAGFDPTHLIAVGYGESRPLVPNRDAAGESIPANQNQNRRVIIKIYKHAESSLIDTTSDTPSAGPKE